MALKGIRTTIKPQILPWISTDEGMLAMNGKRGKWEVRHAPLLCCNLMEKNTFSIHRFCFVNRFSTHLLVRNHISATSSAYPSTCLAFFVSSWRVHLDLQTLICLFFSLAFSFWFSIYCYPYCFQGPRLGSWDHPSNGLDRLLSLFYNWKFKTWHDPD